MALFLSESVEIIREVSLQEAMEAIVEMVQEDANLTEAMLKADFVIHEKTRVLRESGSLTEAKEQEQGFLARVWAAIVAFCKRIYEMIGKVLAWVKDHLVKFWKWVSEKFGDAKEFVIDKYKQTVGQTTAEIRAELVAEAEKGTEADSKKVAELEKRLREARAKDKENGKVTINAASMKKMQDAAQADAAKAMKAAEKTRVAAEKAEAEVSKLEAGKKASKTMAGDAAKAGAKVSFDEEGLKAAKTKAEGARAAAKAAQIVASEAQKAASELTTGISVNKKAKAAE